MARYEEKNIQFRDDDFQLIQADKRIMDTKLDTKPTTFFRDAVRSAVLTILTTFSGALSRHRRQSSRPSMRIAAGISGWNGWLGRRRGRLWKSGLCR